MNINIGVLKSIEINGQDLDELVALSATGKLYRAEYEANGLQVPVWVDSILSGLKGVIALRHRDVVTQELLQLRARLQALKPAAERRLEVEAEIAEHEKTLAELDAK